MKRILLTLALLGMLSSVQGKSEDIREAIRIREAVRGEKLPIKNGAGEIEFDAEMYELLNPSCRNMRILAPDGRNIPFTVREKWSYRPGKIYVRETGSISSFRIDEKKNEAILEYRMDDKNKKIARVDLEVRNPKFVKTVTLSIYDSEGKLSFGPKDFAFFNFSPNAPVSKTSFEFPPSEAKKIVLVINRFKERKTSAPSVVRTGENSANRFTEEHIAGEELSIERVSVSSLKTKMRPHERLERSFSLIPESRMETKDGTRLVFKTGNLPIVRLRFHSSAQRFERKVSISFLNDAGKEEKMAKESVIRRIKNNPKRTPEILLGGIRVPKIAVTIRNGDNPPLPDLKIDFTSVRHSAVFPEESALPTLKVAFGGRLKLKTYDLESTLDPSTETTWKYRLTPSQKNPAYAPGMRSDLLERYGVAAAILLAVLVIGLILRSLFRNLPEDEDNSNGKE